MKININDLWIYFGSTHEFSTNNYRVKTLFGRSVVVYSDSKEYFSFENYCPHRGAKFFTDEAGFSKIVCPFHGWSFKANGDLNAIPFENKMYCYEEKNNLNLKKFKIVLLGVFIFINFNENADAIENQFTTEMIDDLKLISNNIDDSYSLAKIDAKCSWKQMIEITHDELHVPFVHSNTLNRKFKYKPKDYSGGDVGDSHASTINCVKDLSQKFTDPWDVPAHEWHRLVEATFGGKVYLNWYFFPNLHMASADGGITFSYENLMPISASETLIEYFFATAKFKTKYLNKRSIHNEAIRIGIGVYMEDVKMMENISENQNLRKKYGLNYGRYESNIKSWLNLEVDEC
jgi:phenylpropionate dioxygenase-like ring-hydroxylating dioxygenase large terminal subunit